MRREGGACLRGEEGFGVGNRGGIWGEWRGACLSSKRSEVWKGLREEGLPGGAWESGGFLS